MKLSEVAKYASAPTKDEKKLASRKKLSGHLAQLSAGLGLTTLTAKAPAAAKFAAKNRPALAKPLRAVIEAEPVASRVSNAAVPVALGTGAGGSLLYSKIQAQEARIQGGKVKKRDDRFLREYRNRISPKAEAGYNYLRAGRNAARTDTALSAGFAGVSGALAQQAYVRRQPVLAAIGGTSAALNSVEAYRSGSKARRWNGKMNKIKARAYQRARDGEYGRIGPQPEELAKALIPKLRPRAGSIGRRRTAAGITTYTTRGSVPGTGRLFR